MIKELRLKDWKSFKDSTLHIDPLTILIGTNASGKSNTLDALLFLQRVSSGIQLFQAVNGDVSVPALRGGIEWVCRKPRKSFTLEILLEGNSSKQEYRYELTVKISATKAEVSDEKLTLLTYGPRSDTPKERPLFWTKEDENNKHVIPSYFYTATKGPGKRIDLNRYYSVLSQLDSLNLRKEIAEGARHISKQFARIFVFDPIPSHMRGYEPFSETLKADGSNIAGVLAGLPTARKDEVEETLTNYLRRLPERDIRHVWTESVGKFKTDAMLYCEEGWDESSTHEIDARGMSDGTLRYLAVVTAILTREPGSLLVIEEVDNGLHPSRAKILIEMLHDLGRSGQVDVIITTHNPALLDAAGARMVPYITVVHRNDSSGASHLRLLEDVEQLPKLMAAGSLGRLSSEGRIESAIKQARG